MRDALCALVTIVAASVAASPDSARADERATIGYNRDVRPILSENCFPCHGPDGAARKADLRLDQRGAATADLGGYAVIVPGDADASELIARVESADETEVMPPPGSHKTISPEQKAVLRRWIAEGGEYEPHWSFLAPKKAEPPVVKDEAAVRNAIDRFVLARLDAEGLAPAAEADRRTLVRRLSLDLTGLPPDPATVEAFVADSSPVAYERLVEQFLDSPAWGEHRARTWLDAARYADTHGFHFDNFREMWTYRDWVIDAFNRNLPFDQFTVEQLAGDLLPDATLDQQVASGFNRCNMSTNEGGTILEENLVLYTRDRTETTAAVFLGLTANCAVCHDHKYDPFTQKDFYELAAFFNNTTVGALDGNIKDTPPIRVVPDDADRPRYEAIRGELAEAREAIESRKGAGRAEFDAWLAGQSADTLGALTPTEGLVLRAALSSRDDAAGPLAAPGGRGPVMELAGVGDFEKDQPFAVAAWVRPLPGKANGSIVARMDDRTGYRGWDLWLQDNRVGIHLVHEWPADALKVLATAELPEGVWTHVALSYDGSGAPDGVSISYDGVKQPTKVETNSLKSTIRTEAPLTVGQRLTRDRVEKAAVHDLRVYARGLAGDEADRLAGSARAAALAGLPAEKRPAADLEAAFAWWLRAIDPAAREAAARIAALESEESLMRARGSIAHVMEERGEPAMAFILFRGEYDKRREQVGADTPEALPPLGDLPRNRLGLARWLVRDDHPLTARVAVNRFWQEVFGTGLVRTTGDFGVAGEQPSHPELLDWLAVSFRESGWDVKGLFRLMVNSATYRQAAVVTPEKLGSDPENRLLARGPRFRLDAEVIRDYALSSGGLLVDQVGGPSVRPYQPEGVWEAVAMPESNTRSYKADDGHALHRRSLYTFWKRAAPPASMEILNAPSREVCTVRRERTNTPLQALVTLNDPQFVEAAMALAAKTLTEGGSDRDARIDFLALRVLARPLAAEEASIVRGSLEQLHAFYREHPDAAAQLLEVGQHRPEAPADPAELAAWTMLANQMLNLDEALTK